MLTIITVWSSFLQTIRRLLQSPHRTPATTPNPQRATQLHRHLLLALSVVTAACSPLLAAPGDPALVDHLSFAHPSDPKAVVTFAWHVGDRTMPLRGVQVPSGGSYTFTARTGPAGPITLELREFRTTDHQSPAYVVSVNGKPIAFRCRQYDATGPASAFVDLPDGGGPQAQVTVTNRAATPLCFSEAFVYRDIEAYARACGFLQPMRLGPTVDTHVTASRLAELRHLVPSADGLLPMAVVPTFAIAQWPPEVTAQTLREIIDTFSRAGMPVELQLNTWWAGTPLGCDDRGGRWCDPEYQQVTFDPDSGVFGLSVPNYWSSVPWLTTAHPALNAFKANCFRDTGRMLRAEWDRLAASGTSDLPVMSIVMDNEVAYWGAGNPNTPPHLQADFNLALVRKAAAEGVKLAPERGLSPEAIEFLRRNLRDYNRRMAQALLSGLGRCPLADRVYTHTFLGGWCFDTPMQQTEVGVLNRVRMGGEWSEGAGPVLDLHRELGVPANINCELGGHTTSVAAVVAEAYAAGCDHISLFNIPDEGLRATGEELAKGWPEAPPVPWRKRLVFEDFSQGDRWKKLFFGDGLTVDVIWPGPMRALFGSRVGQSSRAMMHVTARATTGKDTFERLALSYKARAFVADRQTPDAYMAIRAGTSPEALREVSRIHDASGRFLVDLTEIARGQRDLYLEFEFHPLGLAGWVCLFDCALEEPWDCEALLRSNGSYRADRLRAESSIVAWRAEASWAIQACETAGVAAGRAQALFAQGQYEQAATLAQDLLRAHQTDSYRPWQPPLPDREEAGEARGVSATEIAFDPYDGGCMCRRIPVTQDTQVTLIENGDGKQNAQIGDIRDGDDVRVTVRGGKAARIVARRGTMQGAVALISPATPFDPLRIKVLGDELRPVRTITTVRGRGPARAPAACPVVVGDSPFAPGDTISIRWNPYTGRIVEAQLAESK